MHLLYGASSRRSQVLVFMLCDIMWGTENNVARKDEVAYTFTQNIY